MTSILQEFDYENDYIQDLDFDFSQEDTFDSYSDDSELYFED